jgi:tRNA(Arg) A34 adenosine deaminase TadA
MEFLERAIDLATQNVLSGGGPFGAIIVQNGKIIATGSNKVTLNNDPTAHAEVVAIREACLALNTWNLAEAELYTSCEPCPMCLGAVYWSGIRKVYYAATREDAATAGFSDALIYNEINLSPEVRSIPFVQVQVEKAKLPFQTWKIKEDKLEY